MGRVIYYVWKSFRPKQWTTNNDIVDVTGFDESMVKQLVNDGYRYAVLQRRTK